MKTDTVNIDSTVCITVPVVLVEVSNHEIDNNSNDDSNNDDDNKESGQASDDGTITDSSKSEGNYVYVSARVADKDSPWTPNAPVATTLDPWDQQPTMSASFERISETIIELIEEYEALYEGPEATAYPIGEEDPLTKKRRRRHRRRSRMAVVGAGGYIVGIVLLGPIGAVVGAVSGAVLARTICKFGERRKDKRVRKQKERDALTAQNQAS